MTYRAALIQYILRQRIIFIEHSTLNHVLGRDETLFETRRNGFHVQSLLEQSERNKCTIRKNDSHKFDLKPSNSSNSNCPLVSKIMSHVIRRPTCLVKRKLPDCDRRSYPPVEYKSFWWGHRAVHRKKKTLFFYDGSEFENDISWHQYNRRYSLHIFNVPSGFQMLEMNKEDMEGMERKERGAGRKWKGEKRERTRKQDRDSPEPPTKNKKFFPSFPSLFLPPSPPPLVPLYR